MSSSLPSTRRAVVTTGKGQVAVQDVRLPTPGEGELVVRTAAVGLNPTDWKSLELAPAIGAVIGVDFAGEVVQLGPNVSEFKVGDKVTGFVHGSVASDHDFGAFAEYVLAYDHLLAVLPETMSWAQGATLGVGITTVGQALGQALRLPLPSPVRSPPSRLHSNRTLLVYAGHTATGSLAVQLARMSGVRVITTCSSEKFSLMRALGAEQVFDYVRFR